MRFIIEINWNNNIKAMLGWYSDWPHVVIFPAKYIGPETAPTNRLTIARWMTKYVLRRCSWRCFINTTMVMILSMTMARHSAMRTTSQGMHSEAESDTEPSPLVLLLVLLLVSSVAIKFHFEGNQSLALFGRTSLDKNHTFQSCVTNCVDVLSFPRVLIFENIKYKKDKCKFGSLVGKG